MKVTQIISSFNRPAQLDLLLRSCQEHWAECNDIFVLWKASNNEFLKGYDKLISEFSHTNIGFIRENNFKNDIISLITNKNDYILMNSDDNVFINRVDTLPNELKEDEICFSLRYAVNINYCLPAKIKIKQPKFFVRNIDVKSFIWDWTKCNSRGAYGYPMPYDSHIYRKDWLLKLLEKGKFNNPYELENYMNTHRDFSKPYMMSFYESKLISLMANTTGQNNNPNMQGKGQSIEELNQKWLNGYRISTNGLSGMKPTQCHIYWNYEFERDE